MVPTVQLRPLRFLLFCVAGACLSRAADGAPNRNAQAIIAKSVQANQLDFSAAPHFSYKERDRTADGSKTYLVWMIAGSPYRQLIQSDGRPLSADARQEEARKLAQAKSERKAESPDQRRKRIDKYEADRHRDNAMMQELTKAFDFSIAGETKLNSFPCTCCAPNREAAISHPTSKQKCCLRWKGCSG